MERRAAFPERSNALQYANSDEEEDGYDSPRVKRKGASVDEFLKGSELGKQVMGISLAMGQEQNHSSCFVGSPYFSSLIFFQERGTKFSRGCAPLTDAYKSRS